MTPATPLVLTLYRQPHRIVPVRDFDEDWGQFIFRCEHDHLRVHHKSPTKAESPWVHDEGEIANALRLERGEVIRW